MKNKFLFAITLILDIAAFCTIILPVISMFLIDTPFIFGLIFGFIFGTRLRDDMFRKKPYIFTTYGYPIKRMILPRF